MMKHRKARQRSTSVKTFSYSFYLEQQKQRQRLKQHEPLNHDAKVRAARKPAIRGTVYVTRTK
jgi:hypothetical protein